METVLLFAVELCQKSEYSMKVGVIHSRYQQRGGEDSVVDAEVQMLQRGGHNVCTFISENSDLAQMSMPAQAMATVWNRNMYNAVTNWTIKYRPDIVHIHNTFPYLSPSVIIAVARRKIPIVMTLHNYRLFCVNGLLFRNGRPCEACLGRSSIPGIVHQCYRSSTIASSLVASMQMTHHHLRTYEHISKFLVLTESGRDRMIRGGLPADKLVIKPNFTLDFGKGRGEGVFALFVGRLTTEKGIKTLLKAWDRIGGRIPLKIVGDGPLREDLASLDIQGVSFLGSQPAETVRDLMKSAHVLIFPSEWYETFGLVVIEAMSCGTPALVSSISTASDFVSHRVNGLHFSAGDPDSLAQEVIWSLDHVDEWKNIKNAAREEYQNKYNQQKNLEILERVYTDAIESFASQDKV